jgi:tetratricopeptide (TPR) repeat protein
MRKKIFLSWLAILLFFSIGVFFIDDEEAVTFTFSIILIIPALACLLGGFFVFKPKKTTIKRWKSFSIINGIFIGQLPLLIYMKIFQSATNWISIFSLLTFVLYFPFLIFHSFYNKFNSETKLYYKNMLRVNSVIFIVTTSVLLIPPLYMSHYVYGKDSVKYNEQLAIIHLNKAFEYEYNNNIEDAIQYANKAFGLANEYHFDDNLFQKCLNFLAKLKHNQGNHDEAIELLNEIDVFYRWKTPQQILENLTLEYTQEFFTANRRKAMIYADYQDYHKSDSLFQIAQLFFKEPFDQFEINECLAQNKKSAGNHIAADSLLTAALLNLKSINLHDNWHYLQLVNESIKVKFLIADTVVARNLLIETVNLITDKYKKDNNKTIFVKSLQIQFAAFHANYAVAEKLLLENLRSIESINGKKSFYYLDNKLTLAKIYLIQSKLLETKNTLDSCETSIKNNFDKYPPIINKLNAIIAKYYESNREYDLAIKHANKYLIGLQDYFGEFATSNILAYDMLADMHYKNGDTANFHKAFTKSTHLIYKDKSFSPNLIVNTLTHIGLYKIEIDSFIVAEENLLAAMRIYKNIFGENHPTYAVSKTNLAFLMHKKKKFKDSIKLYKEALAIATKTQQASTILEGELYINIGLVYADLDNNKLALKQFEKAFTIFLKIYDKKHFFLTKLSNKIEECKTMLNKKRKT